MARNEIKVKLFEKAYMACILRNMRALDHVTDCLAAKKTLTRNVGQCQRDGRPAEHRWRSLFNAAEFG